MDNDGTPMGGRLSRRTFLKATGTAGAAVLLRDKQSALLAEACELAPKAAAAPAEEKVLTTFCQMCGPAKIYCTVRCHVRDGRFVNVEGMPGGWNDGKLCAKGNAAMQQVYAPQRIRYPMKRVGPKGPGAKFQRITWDEALETIATKLKEVKEEYGPHAFGVLSPQEFRVYSVVCRRFLNAYGSPNYCHSAICSSQTSRATQVTIGSFSIRLRSLIPGEWSESNLMLLWGSNPENSAVVQGMPLEIVKAKERGAKLIVIKPMMDPLAAKADIWLPIRPGTDAALALAMLNVIINEKLYDAEFVSEWCHGFDQLRDHVQQYTPEWAAPITGIAADRIAETARVIATTKPMVTNVGNAFDCANDTTSAVQAVCLIVALTGNLDRPGGNRGSVSGVLKTKNVTLSDRATPEMVQNLVAPEFPRWYQKPGSTTAAYYQALMSVLTGKPYPLRAICAQSTNPLSATRNPEKVAEALTEVDFFFVMDLYMAPSADYADVVLPACTGYEHGDEFGVVDKADGSWIGIYNKIVEPLGECKSDWQFWLDLGVKMGMGQDFWDGSMEKCMEEQLEPSGLTVQQLKDTPEGFWFPRKDPVPYERYSTLFQGLPEGKVQCYNDILAGQSNAQETGTLGGLPTYQGPPEGIAQTPDLLEEYPLIFSDVHAYRLCVHSYMHDIPWLRERQPYPWVRINPETARKYGIADGDWVKVESKYGWCKLQAVYFEGLPPEVLMSKRGWWQPCDELGLPGYSVFNGGSETNVLYNSDLALFDGFTSAMSKQTLVKISKA